MTHATTRTWWLLVAMLAALVVTVASADEGGQTTPAATPTPVIQVTPAGTPVLLLPVLDKSNSVKKAKTSDRVTGEVRADLVEQLRKLGFPVVEEQAAATVLKDSKIDWTDRDEWVDTNFAAVAQAAQAKWVVGVIMMSSQSQMHSNLVWNQKKGDALVRFLCFDLASGKRVLDDEFVGKCSGSPLFAMYQSDLKLKIKAMKTAVGKGLDELRVRTGLAPAPTTGSGDQPAKTGEGEAH
jgi:hypothetical protein